MSTSRDRDITVCIEYCKSHMGANVWRAINAQLCKEGRHDWTAWEQTNLQYNTRYCMYCNLAETT